MDPTPLLDVRIEHKEITMTQIYAYLSFRGNCREAMTFYQKCLGGELFLQTVEGTPVAAQMPTETGQNILHSTLTHGSLVLKGSDMMHGERVEGNMVSLMLNCNSDAEIRQFFTALSADGQVTLPLADQFWGATFGTLTDKYGKGWMLNYNKTSAP
jgi:PhnB protein